MGIFTGMGKRPKPRAFDYKPRFYTEETDELKDRLRRVREMHEDKSPEGMKKRISGAFRKKSSYRGSNFHQGRTLKRGYLLIIIIFGLIYLTFVVLDKYLPQIERFLQ